MKVEPKQTNRSPLASFLCRLPLFAGVNEETMDLLEKSSFTTKVPRGEFLFLRGDPANAFYLLLTGEINLVLVSSDGRELVINEMHSGDFFGELGLLTGQTRSADAVARETSALVGIPRNIFLKAIEMEPKLARRLLEVTAHRLSRTSEFQSALAFMDAQARLARVLLDLDQQNEEKGYITISQEELAHRSGLIRQTVAKTLGQWRRKGWLLTGRGHIMLLNRSALSMWFKEHTV